MKALSFDWDISWLVVDWTLFGIATALLWLPFPTLSNRVRMRWLLLRYTQPDVRKVFSNWQNYLDLLRSVVGALVLVRFEAHLAADPAAQPELLWLPKVVIAIGALIQSVRLSAPFTLLAPVFYLAGITLVIPGRLEGAFAVLFGLAFGIGAKDIRLQIPGTAAALVLAGFFNGNLNPWLLVNAGVLLIPLVLSGLLNRRLAFATREPRPVTRGRKPRKLMPSGHAIPA